MIGPSGKSSFRNRTWSKSDPKLYSPEQLRSTVAWQSKSKSKSQSKSLSEHLDAWASSLSLNASIHGFYWYNHLGTSPWRHLVVGIGMLIIICTPVIIFSQAVDFWKDQSLQSAIHWQDQMSMEYPYFTICHPLFFNKQKMEELRVSRLTANYLIYALDPEKATVAEVMRSDNLTRNIYDNVLAEAEHNLTSILSTNNMTVVDLFYALAVSCDEFVVCCEVRRRSMTSGECCARLFDSRPFFNPTSGTCFTGHTDVRAMAAKKSDHVRMWLNVNPATSLSLDLNVLGSDALEMWSPTFVLHTDRDHPYGPLTVNPSKASLGSLTTVAVSKALYDRSLLRDSLITEEAARCIDSDQAFERMIGLNYTGSNCGMAVKLFSKSECTHARLIGINNSTLTKRDCLPSDMVNATTSISDFTDLLKTAHNFLNASTLVYSGKTNWCPRQCWREVFEWETNSAEANFDTLHAFLTGIGIKSEGKYAGLQIFFKSFSYAHTKIFREGIEAFLSHVGGWMGLVMGASVCSFIEMVYFIVYLLFTLFNYAFGRN